MNKKINPPPSNLNNKLNNKTQAKSLSDKYPSNFFEINKANNPKTEILKNKMKEIMKKMKERKMKEKKMKIMKKIKMKKIKMRKIKKIIILIVQIY